MAKPSGLRVLDLYSGAGGFSEGFRQAGFDVVAGIDNWIPALNTHSINNLGTSYNYDMTQILDDIELINTKTKIKELEEKHGRIDVLVGSPPCTEFSFAKNGGKGDIERGMLLVRAFLSFAIALKPRFWLMENVPRLEKALKSESVDSPAHEWIVPLSQLGAASTETWRWVEDGYLKVPKGDVFLASDYGTPQARSRYIAGHFGREFLHSKRKQCQTLHECVNSLNSQITNGKRRIIDPNYPHHIISSKSIRNHNYITDIHPMYWEHMRHLKRRHIQYGKMSFPDSPDKPARTIMATFNPASREAVVIETDRSRIYQGKKRLLYRQPTVREVAILQGFPIDFQFAGNSLSTRYRLVGNAVPCQLAYALALSILDGFEDEGCEDKEEEMRYIVTSERIEANRQLPIIHSPKQLLDDLFKQGFNPYSKFRAKPSRHIRRKIASSKIQKNSAVVVFENTKWFEGKRTGGSRWKSCTQLGVGSKFHQVYHDEVSIAKMLDSIERQIGSTLFEYFEDGSDAKDANRLEQVKELLLEIMSQLESGLPLVPKEWNEFPGHQSKLTSRYQRIRWRKVLSIPSASKLQELFTQDISKTCGVIGPIDFFDGIDALILQALGKPERNWILNTTVTFNDLVDAGTLIHCGRITKQAISQITGKLPLISLISSFVVVDILYRMYIQEPNGNDVLIESIRKSREMILEWCNQ